MDNLKDSAAVEAAALSVWKQGIRASDRVIVNLIYGYSEADTDAICARLEEMERIANQRLGTAPEAGA